MDLINDKIPVKIKLDGGIMPQKKSKFAGAYDLYCPEDTPIFLGRQIINLKFQLEMPPYFKADVRARSGYSSKGVDAAFFDGDSMSKERISADVILGLVDADYRGNVGVILKVDDFRCGTDGWYIPKGERIAQMAFTFVPNVDLLQADSLDMTDDRGGGFGHTNNNMDAIDLSNGDTLAILSIPVRYEGIRKVMEKNKWKIGNVNAHRFFHNSEVSLDDIYKTNNELSYNLEYDAAMILAQWLSKEE